MPLPEPPARAGIFDNPGWFLCRLLQEELTPCYAKLSGAAVNCIDHTKFFSHGKNITKKNKQLESWL